MKPLAATYALLIPLAAAQQFVISTFAGGAPPPTPSAALQMPVQPQGVATDSAGNLYFVSDNCVFRLSANGIVTRIAGNSRSGYSGDGGPALTATFNTPTAIAVDSAGYVYVADSGNHVVRLILPIGIISTFAGTGTPGFSGDGGPAANAQLNFPYSLATDGQRNVFILDGAYVRKVSGGIISTVAGTGTNGYSGDGGPAASAQINATSIAADPPGNLYIADDIDHRIRKISTNGIIATIAGTGQFGLTGDGGPALNATLTGASDIAADPAGNVYFSDTSVNNDSLDCSCVRKISTAGIISHVADGFWPQALAADASGNVYVADPDNVVIREVSFSGAISVATGGGNLTFSGDGGPAVGARMSYPSGVAADSKGNVYISDTFNNRIRMVSPTGVIATFAGSGVPGGSGDGGPATKAQIYFPTALALDSQGNLYIADHGNHSIRKVSPGGTITTAYDSAALGAAPNSDQMWSIAIDKNDNLFVPDASHSRILKIAPDGTITTVAGNGVFGYSGDGGPAISAQIRLTSKAAIATDGAGNLYFSDDDVAPPAPNSIEATPSSPRIRKVSPDGTITTVAGNGTSGYSGDGGPAASAQLGSQLNSAVSLATDSADNLYIGDGDNERIRMVTPNGIIQTIAGTGLYGYTGDGGPAASARFWGSAALAVDPSGSLYLADMYNSVVRLLQPVSSGIQITGVTNAASGLGGAIAPGEIVVITGSGLGPSQLAAAAPAGGFYPAEVAGTSVSFDGVPAPLLYVWGTQVAAVVPYSVNGNSTDVTAVYQAAASAVYKATVTASAPGIFTLDSSGKGQAVAINADGSVNSAANPANAGDMISIFTTGEGEAMPAGVDGQVAAAPLRQTSQTVTVVVGGVEVIPSFAGDAAGQIAGLVRIDFTIPKGTPSGMAAVVVIAGGASQDGVMITVK